jgi:hypothetical protein
MRPHIVGMAFVALLSASAVSALAAPDPYLVQQRQKATRIIIGSEGVTRQQAELLAEVYFFSEVNGCGGPDSPHKRGRDWIVPVRIGPAGAPAGALRISGSSGAVSYKGYPTLLPRDFKKALRD